MINIITKTVIPDTNDTPKWVVADIKYNPDGTYTIGVFSESKVEYKDDFSPDTDFFPEADYYITGFDLKENAEKLESVLKECFLYRVDEFNKKGQRVRTLYQKIIGIAISEINTAGDIQYKTTILYIYSNNKVTVSQQAYDNGTTIHSEYKEYSLSEFKIEDEFNYLPWLDEYDDSWKKVDYTSTTTEYDSGMSYNQLDLQGQTLYRLDENGYVDNTGRERDNNFTSNQASENDGTLVLRPNKF